MWLAFGQQTRELRDGEVVVGSGADADWRVEMADLMPRHFVITVHGLNASLRASSNDNVVVVNGRQLAGTSHLLNDGDVVEAGSGRFVFSDGEPNIVPLEARTDVAYIIDETAGVAQPLHSRSTTLGRDGSNSIVVRDPAASRFHAEVRREAGGFALHSMGSSGTLLNGRRMASPTLLNNGDAIGIAYARFRFVRSLPKDVTLAGMHDASGDSLQRNPALTTGRISVVPARRRPGLGMAIAIVMVVAAALTAYFLTR